MEEIINTASQYGALGLMLLASLWYINKKDNAHREERKTTTEKFENLHNESLTVMRSNTEALTKLSVAIESGKK